MRFFPLKLAGTALWTWVFFIGYFHLLKHPAYPVVTVPATALDRAIPFQPAALIAYVSLWVYVGVTPGLQWRFTDLLTYAFWAGLLEAAGLILFYFWPTQVSPAAYDARGFPGFELLQGIDAAGNACPSMHVAIAIYTAIRAHRLFAELATPRWVRVANAAWFAAIVYSTLALKQHVIIDVVAGAALGALFAAASLRWPRRGIEPRAAMIPAASGPPSGSPLGGPVPGGRAGRP